VTGDDLQARLQAFEGAEVGAPTRGPDPVNAPMIRHWCDAVGDRNPVYTDPELAALSVHRGIVAPPTMLQAWTMRGLRPGDKPAEAGRGPQARLFELLDAAGFTSVVATNCTQEYRRYLRPGDELSVSMRIESVSPEKQTALGPGHFITQRMTYRDQHGEEVATMRFRLLKFRPRAAGNAETAAAPRGRSRPRPGITEDNRFFWDGLAEGRLLIQRCAGCGALRHPPGPMCPRCQSLDWDALEASGRGRVYSYVVAHHPAIPPFEYPHLIALVELEEGTRLVAELAGLRPEEARIGAPVVCEIAEVEPGRWLPRFRPAGNARG
jgi:uncharacterized OB-fold protein/acyl dehydratase